MFKRIFPIATVFVFALAILSISLDRARLCIKPIFATAKLELQDSPVPTPVVTQIEVDYPLAYPGVLPDSPLYKAKMLRDRVLLCLTTNPLKKADLLLLYADKRIGAGKVLIEGNKVPLGISTLIKGEKYFEQALAEANQIRNKNGEIGSLGKRLQLASYKYEGVLSDLKKQVSPEGKGAIDDLLEKVRSLQQEINKFD